MPKALEIETINIQIPKGPKLIGTISRPLSQHVRQNSPRHHAIECRINAEDPYNDFRPSPGTIDLFYSPGGRGVRVDTHVYSGYTVPPFYDSMIAKLIVTGATRDIAIDRMKRALNEFLIEGIRTTIPFQDAILKNSDFRSGDYNIAWAATSVTVVVSKSQ